MQCNDGLRATASHCGVRLAAHSDTLFGHKSILGPIIIVLLSTDAPLIPTELKCMANTFLVLGMGLQLSGDGWWNSSCSPWQIPAQWVRRNSITGDAAK